MLVSLAFAPGRNPNELVSRLKSGKVVLVERGVRLPSGFPGGKVEWECEVTERGSVAVARPLRMAFGWNNPATPPEHPTDPLLAGVANGRVQWWGCPDATGNMSLWHDAGLPKRRDFVGAKDLPDGTYWATPSEFSGGEWKEDHIPGFDLSGWCRVEIKGFSWEAAEDGAEGRAILTRGKTRKEAQAIEAKMKSMVAANLAETREQLAWYSPKILPMWEKALSENGLCILDPRYHDGRCDMSGIVGWTVRNLADPTVKRFAESARDAVWAARVALSLHRSATERPTGTTLQMTETYAQRATAMRRDVVPCPPLTPDQLALYKTAWQKEKTAAAGRGGLGADAYGYSE